MVSTVATPRTPLPAGRSDQVVVHETRVFAVKEPTDSTPPRPPSSSETPAPTLTTTSTASAQDDIAPVSGIEGEIGQSIKDAGTQGIPLPHWISLTTKEEVQEVLETLLPNRQPRDILLERILVAITKPARFRLYLSKCNDADIASIRNDIKEPSTDQCYGIVVCFPYEVSNKSETSASSTRRGIVIFDWSRHNLMVFGGGMTLARQWETELEPIHKRMSTKPLELIYHEVSQGRLADI